MVESRNELLQWVNELCGLNYAKIEQCGTGAAYCQIIDSIFRDVPLSKVKFEALGEHEFIANFKILQGQFTKHKIDRPIPVDKLVKLKMQDNLDFVQWIKRFWEANSSGEPYDPLSRRRTAPGGATRTAPTRRPGAAITKSTTHMTSSVRGAPNNGASSRASQTTSLSSSRPPSATQVLCLQREIDDLSNQLLSLNVAHDSISQERQFYYQKLRDVEIIIQQQVAADPSLMDSPLVKEIYASLYSTDDGFELPDEEDLEQLTLPDGMDNMDDIF